MDIYQNRNHELALKAELPDMKREDISIIDAFIQSHAQGRSRVQFQKQDAERVVRRLAGVKGVSNLITIKSRPTPSELKRKIEDALVRTARSDADRITVEVDGSKVTLKGTVRSWAERQEAERQACAAPGVTSVDNRITISF